MPKSRPPYPPEFKRRLVELVRAGRNPEELAEKSEPTAQSIRKWLAQADRDDGHRQDGLTTEEREELRRLRRENKTLREERDILKKAAAWFARETGSIPPKDSSREEPPGRASDRHAVPRAGRLRQRVLRVGRPPGVGARDRRRGAHGADPPDPHA